MPITVGEISQSKCCPHANPQIQIKLLGISPYLPMISYVTMKYIWLVVYLPLWKIWKSVGIIIPNVWKNKKWWKPPTRYIYIGKYKIYCNHPQLAFPQPGVQIHGICGMEEMQSQSPLGRLETTEHSIGEAQNLHGKDRAKTQHIKISRFLGRKHECSKTGWSSLFWCSVDRIIHRLR